MKTAMQEFSEWLKAYEYELPLELQIKAKECLELEEEQICNAYIDGLVGPYLGAEEYYIRTYNQKGIDAGIFLSDLVKKELDELNKDKYDT